MYPKPVDQLTVEDMNRHVVWEYDLEGEVGVRRDETWVYPVDILPVDNLENRFVTIEVRLANGDTYWAKVGNVSLQSVRKTRTFLDISLILPDGPYHLARYYDPWFEQRGPQALAGHLALDINSVFPIHYDLRAIAVGDPQVLTGNIEASPEERLTFVQRMELSLGR